MVTGAEERCIEEVLPEGGEEGVWCCEVALAIVVQAGQGAEVLGEVEDDLVEEKGADKGDPDPTKVVHHVQVLQGGGRVFIVTTSAPAGEGVHEGVCSR